jgi:hypothetical protein
VLWPGYTVYSVSQGEALLSANCFLPVSKTWIGYERMRLIKISEKFLSKTSEKWKFYLKIERKNKENPYVHQKYWGKKELWLRSGKVFDVQENFFSKYWENLMLKNLRSAQTTTELQRPVASYNCKFIYRGY